MTDTVKSNFQYTTPRIRNFNYSINSSFEDGELEVRLQHRKRIERKSENEAYVELNMKISADAEVSPFEIDYTVFANFKWENMPEDKVKVFLNRTAPSLLVGYIRPIIAMFTNSSGFQPFNLPLIDFTKEPLMDVDLKTE